MHAPLYFGAFGGDRVRFHEAVQREAGAGLAVPYGGGILINSYAEVTGRCSKKQFLDMFV